MPLTETVTQKVYAIVGGQTFYRDEQVKREIKVPARFGMFTPAGNRMIAGYAKTLLAGIEEVTTKGLDGTARRHAIDKVFARYVKAYSRALHSKTHGEAGDTDVREQVYGFMEHVGKALGYEFDEVDTLWEENFRW